MTTKYTLLNPTTIEIETPFIHIRTKESLLDEQLRLENQLTFITGKLEKVKDMLKVFPKEE